MEIPRGRGVLKVKILEAKYEAKLGFPGEWSGGGGCKKNLPWEEYGYFLELKITVVYIPGIVLVHLVTALTLNTAWGWYTISTTFSVSSVCDSRVSWRLPVTSDSLMKNEYGTLSS